MPNVAFDTIISHLNGFPIDATTVYVEGEYTVEGYYVPATFDGPAEFPEVMIGDLWVSVGGVTNKLDQTSFPQSLIDRIESEALEQAESDMENSGGGYYETEQDHRNELAQEIHDMEPEPLYDDAY